MSKSTKVFISLFILFLVLAGSLLYVYYKYERQNSEFVQFKVNASIFTIDKDTGLKVKTGYEFYVNGVFYGDGITDSRSAVLHRIPLNTTVTFKNKNLENQSYYIYEKNISTFGKINEAFRINLDLIKPGTVEILKFGQFPENNINLTVKTTGNIQEAYFCLDWSLHIIFVKVQNYTKYNETNSCFYVGTIEDSIINISLDYGTFGVVNHEDFIIFELFDKNTNFIDFLEIRNV